MLACNDLISLVSLAGEQKDIAGERGRNGMHNGSLSVGNLKIRTGILAEALRNVADDVLRRLAVGIVRCENAEICQLGRNPSELGAAHLRSAADRTEEADQSVGIILPKCFQSRTEADAVVGIDVDYEVLGQGGMLMVTVSGTAVKLGY